MKWDVSLSGFEELNRKLEELSNVAQRSVLTKAVRAAAEPIRGAAAAAAPRGTGRLAADITTQLLTSDNSIDAVGIRIGPTNKRFYGSFTDRGTKFIQGSHWFIKAFQGQIQTATNVMIEVLAAQIKKVTR